MNGTRPTRPNIHIHTPFLNMCLVFYTIEQIYRLWFFHYINHLNIVSTDFISITLICQRFIPSICNRDASISLIV